jgi:TonB-linked SusC/RagA family outer membrane protein
MKCKLLLFIMLFVFTSVGWAQTSTVTGTITDAEGPVIGATVFVKDAPKEALRGTITDIDGKYSLKVAPNEVLVYSFIGYKNVELPVNGRTVIDVVMQLDMAELEQVVVVGYGVQTKASSVGAIGVKKGEDLLKTGSITNLSEALQGQVAGLVSISKTSKPGADDADMLIRGKSTWGNSNPLVLVDGIERNFNDLDFNEIETISVLKDASATAVFGVKGANGVILVTTKRGTSKKAEVSFTANFGLIQPTTSPDWSSYPDALRLFNEAKRNDNAWDGQVPQTTIDAWDNAIANGNYGPYNDVFPQVDWWDETVKKYGTNQSYNVNLRGGSEKMRYFTSLGYLNEGDIYESVKNEDFDPAFYYKRYNWRSNFDFDLTSSTLLSVNIAGNMGYRNQPAYRGGTNDKDDAWFFKFYNQNSSNDFPIKYSDGEWGAAADGEGNLNIYLSESGARMYKTYQGMYDVNLNQELDFLVKGLSAKGSFSYTNNITTQSNIITGKIYGSDELSSLNRIVRYNRVYDYANPIKNADGTITYPLLTNSRKQTETAIDDYPIGGNYDGFKNYSRKFYYELALNYKATFNKIHKVTGLALFNRKNEEFTKDGGLDYPVLEESWVGRGTYSYNEKYLFDVNGAYTGSEKFAPGKRFGFFYSFSLGWRLSEEEFIKSFIG